MILIVKVKKMHKHSFTEYVSSPLRSMQYYKDLFVGNKGEIRSRVFSGSGFLNRGIPSPGTRPFWCSYPEPIPWGLLDALPILIVFWYIIHSSSLIFKACLALFSVDLDPILQELGTNWTYIWVWVISESNAN